jgi:hypothetical protein
MAKPLKPNPYQYIDGTTPRQNLGAFEYFKGTLKEAVQTSLDGDAGSPFVSVIIGGDERTYSNGDNTLKLKDFDIYGSVSSYITLKLAPEWQGLFRLFTENNDYFNDALIEGIQGSGDRSIDMIASDLEGTWPNVWAEETYYDPTTGVQITPDSSAVFGLDSGDYLSIDIDSKSDKVAQMRVKIGGINYFSNDEIDADTWITKLWLRRWNEDAITALSEDEIATGEGLNSDEGEYIEPDPEEVSSDCPVGQELNSFGICVLTQGGGGDNDDDDDDDDDDLSNIEVSGFAMIALLAAVAGVLIIAIRR